MSALAEVFNQLGQDIMPQVTAIVFPDLLTIKRQTTTVSTGGGVIFGAASDAYEDVPCHYKPLKNDTRGTIAGRLTSKQEYEVMFPTNDGNGDRIAFDIETDWFLVAERGNEPTKKFRPVALQDVSGVINKVVCIREDDE